MAHSLGNILVCSAIEDHNLQVEKYFMLNAAVPSEAFKSSMASTSIVNNYMIHEDWTNYVYRTWSSEWYNLFDLPDKRATLTWRGRFANVVSNAYNFYSSEDEVFEMFSGMPGIWEGAWDTVLGRRYCWQKQELFKGCKSLLNPLGSTYWAGWGFEKNLGIVKYTPQEASNLTTNELRTAPVFNNDLYGAFGPSIYSDSLFSTNLVKTQIDELLAKAISALSYAAGKTNIVLSFKPDFNSDIADIDRPNGWINRGGDMQSRWLHEDLIDMAYLYNFKLYKNLVDDGDLDE